MAIEIFAPSDMGTMDNSSYTAATYLYNDVGDPVAVIIGKDEDTPWTIYGEKIWIAVALAKYRFSSKAWDNYNVKVPGLDLSQYNATLSKSNTSGDEGNDWYISQNTSETNMDRSPNESTNKQKSSAKTDAILALKASSAAAAAARSVTWVGGTFDLPRIEVLMRIYQARERIDALDVTRDQAPQFLLSGWGFGSADGDRVWSSSVGSGNSVGYAWFIGPTGYAHYYKFSRGNKFGVIPVIEIQA